MYEVYPLLLFKNNVVLFYDTIKKCKKYLKNYAQVRYMDRENEKRIYYEMSRKGLWLILGIVLTFILNLNPFGKPIFLIQNMCLYDKNKKYKTS